MRVLALIFLSFFFTLNLGLAQIKQKQSPKKQQNHKIIFQMVSKDSSDHNALVRQLFNIQKLAPGTKLEVVCHGPGISFLLKSKSLVLEKISQLSAQNVDFAACEFTMFQKNIERSQLADECRTVPGGILEIVSKQEKGWSYIKSGY